MESTILITGGAGLVGQNLVTVLIERGYKKIVVVDKHKNNLDRLQARHPQVQCIHADLSQWDTWKNSFIGVQRLFLLQAQITGNTSAPFERNTIMSTVNVLRAAKDASIPFIIFVSSSVVNSIADDNYTRSKKEQERLVRNSGLAHCVVRPTLMFGWFDPKHFGWLSRFMEKMPIYPIPGNGHYMRQPLYVRDFCRILIWCAEHTPNEKIYDIVGCEKIDYIDIIRKIKQVKGLHTWILPIPIWLFRLLLKIYGVVFSKPPFVADQLDALVAGDDFHGEDVLAVFNIELTPISQAIEETFCHDVYSKVVLERI